MALAKFCFATGKFTHLINPSLTTNPPRLLAACIKSSNTYNSYISKSLYVPAFLFCLLIGGRKKTLTVKKKAKPKLREQLLNSC